MFSSWTFWAAVVLGGLVTRLLPDRAVRLRALLIGALSAGLIVGLLGMKPVVCAVLAGFIVWVPIGLRLTRGLAARKPMFAAFVAAAPLLVLWVAGKAAVAAELELKWLYFVGFSYLVVKAWTLIKDVHDQRIGAPDPAMVVAYFLFAPTYVSGPMHLFGEFDAAVRAPRKLGVESVIDLVYRIALGLVKVKILVPLLTPLSLLGLGGQGAPLARLVPAAFVYSAVLWADFSGYSDIAIGAAGLLGIETPENFRWPYAAPNIREFWQRWHITFSRVLTSYVFVPIARALEARLGSRPRAQSAIATLVTFVLCGYWHGATLGFVIWGLYHGVLLVGYDFFKADPRKLRKLSPRRRRIRSWAMAVVTFGFVSLGWIFFALPLSALIGFNR